MYTVEAANDVTNNMQLFSQPQYINLLALLSISTLFLIMINRRDERSGQFAKRLTEKGHKITIHM